MILDLTFENTYPLKTLSGYLGKREILCRFDIVYCIKEFLNTTLQIALFLSWIDLEFYQLTPQALFLAALLSYNSNIPYTIEIRWFLVYSQS